MPVNTCEVARGRRFVKALRVAYLSRFSQIEASQMQHQRRRFPISPLTVEPSNFLLLGLRVSSTYCRHRAGNGPKPTSPVLRQAEFVCSWMAVFQEAAPSSSCGASMGIALHFPCSIGAHVNVNA
jgi:hypothetical protein